MAKEVFKSTAKLTEGMRVECVARDHTILLDEPKELGGTDTGMNPVEGVLSALGACKCIVARCFAKAHRIDLQDFHIELEGDLDPDGFMGKNKNAKIGFSEIRSKIYIKSSSSKKDIEKFVEFIDRTCPVADTLTNSPKMVTEVNIER
ncbi:OsmC family protein [Clostridium sp. Cult3]|uniref:OsmC family protein n=1 Tax=Clostridium sp. Cult3 TaxID=2079004 RepID=UPI001F3D7635|nr:OsmC family protein [Clostridium sp. Cult3]MCF6459537.1 peroxiredoxin [Clostridium sp. Cult3]